MKETFLYLVIFTNEISRKKKKKNEYGAAIPDAAGKTFFTTKNSDELFVEYNSIQSCIDM